MVNRQKWKIIETDANLALMANVLGVSETTARVMANRGIRSKNAALLYLQPALSRLHDPLCMKDVDKAFARFKTAIANGEKIMVYGDYDADGVMSTAILCKMFRACGAAADFYMPSREEEGYGLNAEALRRIRAAETDLVVTCDNGIAALAEAALANDLGLDLVIIDHHEPGFVEATAADGEPPKQQDVVPKAVAVVDPKQAACPYPFKSLCAAGLAYKLAVAFCRYMGRPCTQNQHDEWLALAAVATVCDIVDLQGENRIIVKNGLAVLNANKAINPGLGALIASKGYGDRTLDTFTAGFVLGPCINATGRLDNAAASVQLMLSETAEERAALSERLTAINEKRKNMTAACVARMLERLSAIPAETMDKVLVLTDEETHESIAGIVAGRVKEIVGRPVIVLTPGGEPGAGLFKGSGRSIEGYNMFDALYRNRGLFVRFGGHAMAAGMTISAENIPKLRAALNASCELTDRDFDTALHLDGILSPADVTYALAVELGRLAPFGKGNPEPLFLAEGLRLAALRAIPAKNTLIFTMQAGGKRTIKGIAFGMNEQFEEALRALYDEFTGQKILAGVLRDTDMVIDAVFQPETNFYNGEMSVQMRIKDFVLRRQAVEA